DRRRRHAVRLVRAHSVDCRGRGVGRRRCMTTTAGVLLVVVLFQTTTHRLSTAFAVGSSHAFVGAALTLVVRMILIPFILWAALNRVTIKTGGLAHNSIVFC